MFRPPPRLTLFPYTTLFRSSWAKRFLFRSEQLETAVSRLSGGEKARIVLARLMLQPADLLVLDEPTNDLDIRSEEHTSELQSLRHLVCRLLLEKKKKRYSES